MNVYKVDAANIDMNVIHAAADAIRRGELVVFPTETVYGLAADALNDAAVRRVYQVKGRSEIQPLPVQIAGMQQLDSVVSCVPNAAKILADRFWPGPLTLIMPKNKTLSDLVTGDRGTVGVRVPDHPVALALLRELASPVIATSANISGGRAAISAEDAISELGDNVSVVLDAGESKIGMSSTVVDVSVAPIKILRCSTITIEQIKEALGEEYEHEE